MNSTTNPEQSPNHNQPKRVPPQNPSGGSDMLAFVAILALIVGGLGYGAYKLFSHSQSGEEQQVSDAGQPEEQKTTSSQPESSSSDGNAAVTSSQPSVVTAQPAQTTNEGQQTQSDEPKTSVAQNTPDNGGKGGTQTVKGGKTSVAKAEPNMMFKDKNSGLWGVRSGFDGPVIVEPKYEDMFWVSESLFPNALAYVKLEGKWGILGKDGQPVSKLAYDHLMNAKWIQGTDLVIVSSDRKYGCISTKGEELVPCIYDEISDKAENGLVEVKSEEHFGYLLASGQEAIPCKYEEFKEKSVNGVFLAKRNGLYGFVNKTGQEITAFEIKAIYSFGNTTYSAAKNNLWAIYTLDGKAVTDFVYTNISSYFDNGVAIATKNVDGKKLLGCLNKQGREVVPVIYDDCEIVSDRQNRTSDVPNDKLLFIVKKDGKFGLLNKEGNPILPLEYKEIEKMDSLFRIKNETNQYALYTDAGVAISQFIYERLDRFNSDGYAIAVRNAGDEGLKKGVIDTAGKEVIPTQYDDLSFARGKYLVKNKMKWGLVDSENKVIIPIEYKGIESCNDGTYIVKNDENGCALFDAAAKPMTPFDYSRINNYSRDGIRYVYKRGADSGEKVGIMNAQTGKEIIPCDYTSLQETGLSGYFYARTETGCGILKADGKPLTDLDYYDVQLISEQDGLFMVQKNVDKKRFYGIINKSGQEFVPMVYKYIDYRSDRNLYKVSKHSETLRNGVWGFIDRRTGKEAIPCEYDTVELFMNGLAVVSKDKQYGYINESGTVVIPLQYDYADSFWGEDNKASVRKDNRRFYIDRKGNEIGS